jgi:hypothetical protein
MRGCLCHAITTREQRRRRKSIRDHVRRGTTGGLGTSQHQQTTLTVTQTTKKAKETNLTQILGSDVTGKDGRECIGLVHVFARLDNVLALDVATSPPTCHRHNCIEALVLKAYA